MIKLSDLLHSHPLIAAIAGLVLGFAAGVAVSNASFGGAENTFKQAEQTIRMQEGQIKELRFQVEATEKVKNTLESRLESRVPRQNLDEIQRSFNTLAAENEVIKQELSRLTASYEILPVPPRIART